MQCKGNFLGFLLLEILCVLALSSLFLFLSVPVLKRSANAELRLSARELIRELDALALQVRQSGQAAALSYERAQNSLTKHRLDDDGHLLAGSANEVFFPLPPRSSIERFRFAQSTLGPAFLLLRPDGTTTPGRIVLKATRGERCTIVQSLRGRRTLTCSS